MIRTRVYIYLVSLKNNITKHYKQIIILLLSSVVVSGITVHKACNNQLQQNPPKKGLQTSVVFLKNKSTNHNNFG